MTFFRSSSPLAKLEEHCKSISDINPKETHKLAAFLQELSVGFYKIVQHQAIRSFYVALGASGIATLFFLWASYLVMHKDVPGATLGVIAGALIQVISGITFYLYSRTARQFAGFHICLERMDRYLLANSYCENLSTDAAKDDCRRNIINIMATAPMLTVEQVSGLVPQPEREVSAKVGRGLAVGA